MKTTNQISLIITDGDCEFCQLSAAWLQRNFPGDWINQPSQSADLDLLGLTKAEVAKQVWYLRPKAGSWQKFGGAQAVFKLLLDQPKKYIKPIALLFLIPGPNWIAQAAYIWVTKNRHRLMWIFKR